MTSKYNPLLMKMPYFGAIIFSSENGYASLGQWVKLKIYEDETLSEKITITGNSIGAEISKVLTAENIVFGSSIILTILSLLFLILVLKRRRKTYW